MGKGGGQASDREPVPIQLPTLTTPETSPQNGEDAAPREYFQGQIKEVRRLRGELEDLCDQVSGAAGLSDADRDLVEKAKLALDDILDDQRFALMRTGAVGLRARRELAQERALDLLDSNDWWARGRLSHYLDSLDACLQRVKDCGESAVVSELNRELDQSLTAARASFEEAVAVLRAAR